MKLFDWRSSSLANWHRGKNFQCQLANEDDLQSKSVIIEIVLRIVFYIRIDYRHSFVMKFLNSLPLMYTA